MDNRHTPGPWAVGELGETFENCWPIESENGGLAHVESWCMETSVTRAEAKANAALIAAAPELLDVLKRVQGLDETKVGHDLLADIDEAINKAEGRNA